MSRHEVWQAAEASRRAQRASAVAELAELAKRHGCGVHNDGSHIKIHFQASSGMVEWSWSMDQRDSSYHGPFFKVPAEQADAFDKLAKVLRDPNFNRVFAAALAKATTKDSAESFSRTVSGYRSGSIDDTSGT